MIKKAYSLTEYLRYHIPSTRTALIDKRDMKQLTIHSIKTLSPLAIEFKSILDISSFANHGGGNSLLFSNSLNSVPLIRFSPIDRLLLMHQIAVLQCVRIIEIINTFWIKIHKLIPPSQIGSSFSSISEVLTGFELLRSE